MDMFKLILIYVDFQLFHKGPSWRTRSYRYQFWPQSSCLSSWCSGSTRLRCFIFLWLETLPFFNCSPLLWQTNCSQKYCFWPKFKVPKISQQSELYSWWLSLRQLKYNLVILLMHSCFPASKCRAASLSSKLNNEWIWSAQNPSQAPSRFLSWNQVWRAINLETQYNQ